MNMLHRLALPTLAVLALFAPATIGQDVPFNGVVTSEKTSVRAGAGRTFYVVGELEKGEMVRVVEVLYDWYKIAPPPGVYSYVSKGDVNASGDGGTGTVNRDRVPVLAASVNGPGESYRRQKDLMKGDTVDVVGEDGSFYRIVPPDGAHVFVAPGTLRRATPTDMKSPRRMTDPSQPAREQRSDQTHDPSPARTPPAAATEPADSPDASADRPADSADSATTGDSPAADADDRGAAPEVAGEGVQGVDSSRPASERQAEPDADDRSSLPAERAERRTPRATETEPGARASAEEKDGAGPDAASRSRRETADRSAGRETAAASDRETDAAEEAALGPAPQVRLGGVTFRPSDPGVIAAERRMQAALAQPLEAQPIDELTATFEDLSQEELSERDAYLVQVRLAMLQRNQKLAESVRRIAELREQSQSQPSAQEIIRSTAGYDAVGQIQASRVYDGRRLPRLLRLVDPANGRTLAYLRVPGTFDIREVLGEVVGIQGRTEVDPGLRVRVVQVQAMDVLRRRGETEPVRLRTGEVLGSREETGQGPRRSNAGMSDRDVQEPVFERSPRTPVEVEEAEVIEAEPVRREAPARGGAGVGERESSARSDAAVDSELSASANAEANEPRESGRDAGGEPRAQSDEAAVQEEELPPPPARTYNK